MKLERFLLEEWLEEHAGPPVEFNLALSTGPVWRLRELLALSGAGSERLLDLEVVYSRAPGGASLREAIAQMQGVAPDQVLVTIGAAEALSHVFYAAAEPGANVVIPFPSFPPHRSVPAALGLEVRSYHVRRDKGFQVDVDEVMRLADSRTKLILVNSPHNPTGSTLSDSALRSLHDFAAGRGIQFVSDEVYHPIYHGRETGSAARLEHATVIGDFSKAFALSGLRLGWMIEPNAQRLTTYVNSREYLTISNSPIVESLAEIAVRHRDAILTRTRDVAQTNLRLVKQAIGDYSEIVQWVQPQGGMTGFPWLVSGENARPFCEAATNAGLLFAPGDCFGIADHFRVGFGVGPDWYPRAMDRFSDFLSSWARKRPAAATAS